MDYVTDYTSNETASLLTQLKRPLKFAAKYHLYATNEEVQRHNMDRLASIDAPQITYKCVVRFDTFQSLFTLLITHVHLYISPSQPWTTGFV